MVIYVAFRVALGHKQVRVGYGKSTHTILKLKFFELSVMEIRLLNLVLLFAVYEPVNEEFGFAKALADGKVADTFHVQDFFRAKHRHKVVLIFCVLLHSVIPHGRWVKNPLDDCLRHIKNSFEHVNNVREHLSVVVSEVGLDLLNHLVAVGDLLLTALDPLRKILSHIDLARALKNGQRFLQLCLLINKVGNLLLYRLEFQTESHLVRGLFLDSANFV